MKASLQEIENQSWKASRIMIRKPRIHSAPTLMEIIVIMILVLIAAIMVQIGKCDHSVEPGLFQGAKHELREVAP